MVSVTVFLLVGKRQHAIGKIKVQVSLSFVLRRRFRFEVPGRRLPRLNERDGAGPGVVYPRGKPVLALNPVEQVRARCVVINSQTGIEPCLAVILLRGISRLSVTCTRNDISSFGAPSTKFPRL